MSSPTIRSPSYPLGIRALQYSVLVSHESSSAAKHLNKAFGNPDGLIEGLSFWSDVWHQLRWGSKV